MLKRVLLCTSLVLAPEALESATSRGFRVIVHPETEVATVGVSELSKIFLGRIRTWASGQDALPVDQRPEAPVRGRFTRHVHEKAVVSIEVYWKRMIFSGRGVPPPEVASDRAVVDFVRSNPGAVGYVSESAPVVGVRELVLSE